MIPNLLKKETISTDIHEKLLLKIEEFSATGNKEEFLKKSFFYIVNQWSGSRINLLLKFSRLFQTNISQICNTKGYMHCTTMNYLLRTMAIESGLFKDEDIKIKLTNSWYMAPHQYLQINLEDNKSINLDPWNYQFGIDYGEYGSGFKSVKLNPIR